MQSFASQPKQINLHSVVTHKLFFPPVFICLFVWQQVIKGYLKISRNRAGTRARQKSCKEKIQPWDGKKRNRKFYGNRMNRKDKKNKELRLLWNMSRKFFGRNLLRRSTLNNNYVPFQKEMNTVLIISIKDMCQFVCFYQ